MTNALPTADVEQRAPIRKEDADAIRALAGKVYQRRALIGRLLQQIDSLKKEVDLLEERDLPSALTAAGVSRFPLDHGWVVEVEQSSSGSVKEDDVPAVAGWMDAHGLSDLVKHYVTIAFGRGDEKAYKKFQRDMAKRKAPLEVETRRTVHGTTLKKFIKERVAAERRGEISPDDRLPRDLFGVYEATRAVLRGPEEAKGK